MQEDVITTKSDSEDNRYNNKRKEFVIVSREGGKTCTLILNSKTTYIYFNKDWISNSCWRSCVVNANDRECKYWCI